MNTVSQLRAMLSNLETQGFGDSTIEISITIQKDGQTVSQISGMLVQVMPMYSQDDLNNTISMSVTVV